MSIERGIAVLLNSEGVTLRVTPTESRLHTFASSIDMSLLRSAENLDKDLDVCRQ
jgi:hypothetical protein